MTIRNILYSVCALTLLGATLGWLYRPLPEPGVAVPNASSDGRTAAIMQTAPKAPVKDTTTPEAPKRTATAGASSERPVLAKVTKTRTRPVSPIRDDSIMAGYFNGRDPAGQEFEVRPIPETSIQSPYFNGDNGLADRHPVPPIREDSQVYAHFSGENGVASRRAPPPIRKSSITADYFRD